MVSAAKIKSSILDSAVGSFFILGETGDAATVTGVSAARERMSLT